MVRGVLKLRKRFVELLLGGAMSCISELNVKYSEGCLILDVVVQIEKDTLIAFQFFTLHLFFKNLQLDGKQVIFTTARRCKDTFFGDLYCQGC